MNQSNEILKKIHNTDPWIKHLPETFILKIAFTVTILMFFSNYWLRIFWAFLLNLVFNSPKVYASAFGEFFGKRINTLILSLFYLSFFALYSIPFKYLRKKSTPLKRTIILDDDYLYRQF